MIRRSFDWELGNFGDVIRGDDGRYYVFVNLEPKLTEFRECIAFALEMGSTDLPPRVWLSEIFPGMWMEPELDH